MGRRTGKPRGRPSKMKEWNEALKKVLKERKIIFLTDEDLVLLVNQELKQMGHPDKVIQPRQFRRWKAGEIDGYGHAEEFLETLQLAYIAMKDAVGEKLMTDGQFQRWAWILERKFSQEFALVHKQETTHKQETIIQITAGDAEKQKLIDSIINGNAIDVQFTEVEPMKLKRGETDNNENDEYGF